MNFSVKTTPRKWCEKEEIIVYSLYQKGYTMSLIAKQVGRSEESVKNKIRRLKKQRGRGNYDKGHSIQKHLINQRFVKTIKPDTILDLYNGGSNQYKDYNTITNDINTSFNTDFHCDAELLIQRYYTMGSVFDYIDLDPFGSCYPLLRYAIPMAKKAIAITLGEMGHKRFKRLDLVRNCYNINSLEQFNLYNINKYIINYARKHYNKRLEPVYAKDWNHISRIWYKIDGGDTLE